MCIGVLCRVLGLGVWCWMWVCSVVNGNGCGLLLC